MVTRDNALPLKEGQYYLCDVPGAVVINEDTEEEIGKVTDVMETGANNVFVIETKEGKEDAFPGYPGLYQESGYKRRNCKSTCHERADRMKYYVMTFIPE